MVKAVHAEGSLGGDWDQFIGKTGVQKFQGTGGEAIAVSLIRRAISLVKYAMGAVALIFGMMYAINFVFARGAEETITKQKKNFLWTFMGFVILMAADAVSAVFNPATLTKEQVAAGNLIDFQAARDQLRTIVDYLKWMLGSVIVMLMTISGIKMITAGGKEEEITNQKKNLVWSGIGMLVILLASNIVNAIYAVNETTNVAGVANASRAAGEIGGIIRLILVFLGPVAVLFTIYAGFLYLTALDDEEKTKKARSMIVAGITGIVIIYSAYALVNTFYRGIASVTQCQNQCIAGGFTSGKCEVSAAGATGANACVDTTVAGCAQEGKCQCNCTR